MARFKIISTAVAALGALALTCTAAQAENAMFEMHVEESQPVYSTAEYPSLALRRRVEGYVLVEFNVNADGKAEDITILEARPKGFFDKATIKAVQKARYDDEKSRSLVRKNFVYLIDDSIERGTRVAGI